MEVSTPDELAKLKAILAGQPVPTDVAPPGPPPDATPDPRVAALRNIISPGVKQPDVAIPQVDPQAMRSPYEKQSQNYNNQATELETAAAQPRPQSGPALTALRAAMESFGKFGAPGGYYGQEQERNQQWQQQQGAKIAQADKLRALAEKQDQLGVQQENVARQENYNQGQLKSQEELRQRQIAQEQELERHNREMETIALSAPKTLGQGQQMVSRTGEFLAANAPKDTNLRIQVFAGQTPDKPEKWSVNAKGEKQEFLGFAPPPGAGSGGGGNQLTDYTDVNGNSAKGSFDRKTNTITPVHMAGDKANAPVMSSDLGKANVKNDAKNAQDYATAQQSLANMQGQAKLASYAGDQAMADAFFNIIKPGSGARMNQQQIERFITPGPLKDKMTAWAQKLDQGQPLDPAARQALLDAATVAVNSKKPTPRAGTPAAAPAAAPSSAGWTVKVVH